MFGIDQIVGLFTNWLYKAIILAVLLGLFQLFVYPYILPLEIMMLWWVNQTLFLVLSEEAMIFLNQGFIMIITFELVIWIMHTSHDPAEAKI